MKIFSTLFLTLTLIASSASAALDPYNLPTEVPTELQEKLAWGLINRNIPVIEQALDAGADAERVFGAITDQPFPEYAYASPYYAVTYKSKGIFEAGKSTAAMFAEIDEFSRCAEFLIKKGVCIDPLVFQLDMFSDALTFRKAYMRDPEHGKLGNNLPEEVEAYGKKMVLRIQETIKAYQEKNPYQNAEDFIEYRAALDADKAKLLAIKQLPVAPADLQEQLVWGILNLDIKVTEQALNAGANLDAYPSAEPTRPYGLLFFAFEQADKENENSFDNLSRRASNNEPISLDEIVRVAHTIHTTHDMFALLIKHGVSVDEDLGMYVGRVRYLFVPERILTPDDEEPAYIKESCAYLKIIAQSLHALIEKYQPDTQTHDKPVDQA